MKELWTNLITPRESCAGLALCCGEGRLDHIYGTRVSKLDLHDRELKMIKKA